MNSIKVFQVSIIFLIFLNSGAFNSNNIKFSLFTCGQTTTIIKDFEEDWDELAKAKTYEGLQFNDSESNLSDAICFASLHIDSGMSSKTEKTIFVITDGYPSAPKKLRTSLAFAADLGIQVIALGVGFFTDGIFEYFPNHIVVNNPKDMPQALQGYYCREPSPNERHSAIQIESVDSITHEGVKMDLTNAWDKYMFSDVYQKEVQKLNKALYLATAPARSAFNKFQVDLCFVLDTTGSMHGMIKMAQEKIVSITNSIKGCVKKSSDRDAKVRVGFVGYKIEGQDGNLDNVPFTENTERVMEMVMKQTATGGSSGGVEDKYEPLDLALQFSWTGLVKFMVLIADAPGHGLWCTGDEYKKNDDYPNRTQDMMPGLVSRIAKEKIYLFYVTIKKFTDFERDNFRKQYIQSAPDAMKEKGFQELKISSGNDGETLAKLISDTVENIIIAECM